MFRSLQNVQPSHLLDRQLFDFAAIGAPGPAPGSGKEAFDQEEEFSTFSEPK